MLEVRKAAVVRSVPQKDGPGDTIEATPLESGGFMARQTGKENIQRAFLRLLAREAYSGISVKEIAAEAGISRTSYYRHYYAQQDVLDDIIKSVMAEVDGLRVEMLRTAGDDMGERVVLYRMLQVIKEHADDLKIIHDSDAAFHLATAMHRYLLDVTTSSFPPPTDEREEKRQARVRHYHAVGIAAIIFDWIDKRCEDPLTDVVDFLIETQRSSPLRLKRT